MSFWKRLFGKDKIPALPLNDVPEQVISTAQTLKCDPEAPDPDSRFTVNRWRLKLSQDQESQRLARGVLKRSAGKTLRLEPHREVGHRGSIAASQPSQSGQGYRWINVDVDLRAGTIRLHEGGSDSYG